MRQPTNADKERAREVLQKWSDTGTPVMDLMAAEFAAIRAEEREACARIAENKMDRTRRSHIIAQAIRASATA